jgi:polar amino acid transport system permease protein
VASTPGADPSCGPADVSAWNWDVVRRIFPALVEGLWVTVQATLLGIVVAVTLGLVLALLRRSRLRPVSWTTAAFIEVVRGTPLLVQLFFLFYVLPDFGWTLPAFTIGVLALGVHYATYCSEAYRAGIDNVERGQWEAATALNLSPATTWRSVVLPQAIPTVIPALGNYFVAMFKDAPLLAFITVVELLQTARDISSRQFVPTEAFTIAGLLFLAVSIPASLLVRRLERRFGYARG